MTRRRRAVQYELFTIVAKNKHFRTPLEYIRLWHDFITEPEYVGIALGLIEELEFGTTDMTMVSAGYYLAGFAHEKWDYDTAIAYYEHAMSLDPKLDARFRVRTLRYYTEEEDSLPSRGHDKGELAWSRSWIVAQRRLKVWRDQMQRKEATL